MDPRGEGVERGGQAGGQRTADRPLGMGGVRSDLSAETGERRRGRIGGGDACQPQLSTQLRPMGARQRTQLGAQLGPAGTYGIGMAIRHGHRLPPAISSATVPAPEIVRGRHGRTVCRC